ncbi:MAG: HAMP domain-containing histidine kinase [Rhodospirillales bacterium]|nr:HAMP domain-containing histidine kinase [Rhodospirillales bacterium]
MMELAQRMTRHGHHVHDTGSSTKTEFLATISHDLRTPLNAIIGFSDVILEGVFGPLDNPRHDEYVRDINESGRHLLEPINDILDLPKPEAGRQELDEDDVGLISVVALSTKFFREQAERSGTRLGTLMPSDASRLRADTRKLPQLLLNLLSNAVKFTPDHGTVTVEVTARPDGGIDIVISNTGIGMTQSDMVRAFEVFGQVYSALIPKRVDHHALAQFPDPIEVMRSGSLINMFQASQQFATISSSLAKTRFESQLSRMDCQTFSTGFNSGDLGGSGNTAVH